jgi:eukaryotic-like serine/threonine-protein kinase
MEPTATSVPAPATLGRYELLGLIGRGGMANVYLGRLASGAGFQRLFAIKVLHPHLAEEEAFIDMLLDEARIAARLHHPNVVPIVDLGSEAGVHYVVMEYVEGCSLSVLLKRNRESRPARLLIPIILDALSGLHAAHTLDDDDGQPMRLVHRDVSPQNILVGVDGMARLTDFGIAKAESRINSTRPGEVKGKISYMSPEQLRNPESVDCRADIFSTGVLLWSALTGQQLFEAPSTAAAMHNTLTMKIEAPSQRGLKPPAIFDSICLRALERDRDLRLGSALEFEESLRALATSNGLCGSRREVSEWVLATVGEELAERRNTTRSSGNQRVARSVDQPASGSGPISAGASSQPWAVNSPGVRRSKSGQTLVSAEAVPELVAAVIPAASGDSGVLEFSAQLTAGGVARRRLLGVAGLALACAGGVAAVASARRTPPVLAANSTHPVTERQSPAAQVSSQPASLPQHSAPAAAVSGTHAVERSPAAAPRPRSSAVSNAVTWSTRTRPVAHGPAPRVASAGSPDGPGATPAAASNATSNAAASEPPRRKPTWDEDSPLPHP